MSDDDFEDDDASERNPAKRPRHGSPAKNDRASIPGAIASGVVNGVFIALIAAVPGWNLPFIGPGFAAISLAIMVGPAAAVMSAFIRAGYINHWTKSIGKFVERAGGLISSAFLYFYYPFVFTAVGAPPAVDFWLKILFGVSALINGIGTLVNLVRLVAGPKRWKFGRPGSGRRNRGDDDAYDDGSEDSR